MKQSFILLVLMLCISSSAKAESDLDLARDYLFRVNNSILLDAWLSSDEAERKLVKEKFQIATANISKSGIKLGQAEVTHIASSYMFGTNKKVLLVVYRANDAEWDDVVLCFEKETNKLVDIGNVENSFTMNKATVGQNFKNKDNLQTLFDKNAITYPMLIEEVKTLIRQANNHEDDKFCLHVLYTGGDVAKRKSRMEACIPTDPKDKVYCKAVMEDVSGYITNPDDFYVQYTKSEQGKAEITITCNQTKNVRQFVFRVIKGKLLLDGVY